MIKAALCRLLFLEIKMSPVFEINGLFFFYGITDEPIGPYTTRVIAMKAYNEYYSEHSISYIPKSSDPVVFDYEEELWCFWDETWTHAYGPYATEFLANLELQRYARYLNNGN